MNAGGMKTPLKKNLLYFDARYDSDDSAVQLDSYRQSGSIDTDLEQEGDGEYRETVLYSSTICQVVGRALGEINQIIRGIIRSTTSGTKQI